jgi:hypothetical protein
VPATGQGNQNIVARAVSSGTTAGDYIVVFVSPQSGPTGETLVYYTASGAIPVAPATAVLNGAAALAMTLAAPTAAQDGMTIFITAATAHAHTLTTPANGIDGVKHIVTYAAIGDGIVLRAINGTWNVYSLSGPTPAVIS